ncbi:hypothetical protein BDP27DRAFT_1155369, partial [Rhodocollybia butyracea]
VDDKDPRIIYSAGGWTEAGALGFECDTTSHGSNGANATATFSFNGVAVQVFGTVSANSSPMSTYQVDGLPATMYIFNATGQTTYRVQFYTSPLLSTGNHTLIITALENDNFRLWLDYVLYYPSSNVL